MMKAAVVTGKAVKPRYMDFPLPEPSAGVSVVEVRAAALSQLARGTAAGRHYTSSTRYPQVAGVDGVGRLDDGRRVYFFGAIEPFGAMAEFAPVATARCIELPCAIDDVTAAAIAIPGMSSWVALTERAHLVRGETVLINGATGESGQLAVQIARMLGAQRVIATGRNEAKLERLRETGADTIIRLTDDESALNEAFSAAFREGVDVVLDYLWGPSARAMLLAAASACASSADRELRFVQIGSISGLEMPLPAAVLRSRAITLMGSGIGSVALPRLLHAVEGVLHAAADGSLRIATQAVPLAELADHWEDEASQGRKVFVLS
jgi:NADPH2:quinone reductase